MVTPILNSILYVVYMLCIVKYIFNVLFTQGKLRRKISNSSDFFATFFQMLEYSLSVFNEQYGLRWKLSRKLFHRRKMQIYLCSNSYSSICFYSFPLKLNWIYPFFKLVEIIIVFKNKLEKSRDNWILFAREYERRLMCTIVNECIERVVHLNYKHCINTKICRKKCIKTETCVFLR